MAPSVSTFADLLRSAVSDPGVLSAAYRQFHSYSLGNQLLAWSQCIERNIQPGPIASFMGWKEKGRHVKKGEKAITLCMPVTVKHAHETEAGDDVEVFTRSIYRPNWFVLAQTDGEPLAEHSIPAWDADRALARLHVQEIPFDHWTAIASGSRVNGRLRSTRSTHCRTRHASMNWRMCSSAIQARARRTTAKSPHAVCANARPKQSGFHQGTPEFDRTQSTMPQCGQARSKARTRANVRRRSPGSRFDSSGGFNICVSDAAAGDEGDCIC
jgi:hypothetical protein